MPLTGKIQIYTGDGKGKTTAAIGLAIRALGAGLRVFFLQFMKSRAYSEHQILPDISPKLTLKTVGKPFFVALEGALTEEQLSSLGDDVFVYAPGCPPPEYVAMVEDGLEMARQAVSGGAYDLVVLDEILVAQHFGLVAEQKLLELLRLRRQDVELVLTGRGASAALIEKADLVTEMREVKHYFSSGVTARKGLDC